MSTRARREAATETAAAGRPEPAGRAADEVVRAVARCFRRLGYGGTSMSALSEETGLGRSSLYHHFPGGKEEMALAALGAAARVIEGPVAAALRAPAPPWARLRAMVGLLRDYYEDGALGCLLGALATADCPPAVRGAAGRLARSWIADVADFLREAGHPEPERAAARLVAALQGALVVAGATGDRGHFRAALDEALGLVPPS